MAMEDLLEKQIKHLSTIEGLLKTDRLMQLSQTYGIHNIDKEDENSSKDLDHIASTIDSFKKEQHDDAAKTISKSTDSFKEVVEAVSKLNTDSSRYAEIAQKSFVDYSKKLLEIGAKNNMYKSIAENALGSKATKTFGEKIQGKIQGIRDTFGDAKTGKIGLGSVAGAVGRNLLPHLPFTEVAQDRYDYIREEQGRGSKESKETLKENFETRRKTLIVNEKNEASLKKHRGGQSESDFLKGGSENAEKYKANKLKIGETLSKVDSRYIINEPVVDERARPEKTSKGSDITGIADTMNDKYKEIEPLKDINKKEPASSAESSLEADEKTKEYQDAQLKNNEDQTEIFTEQLKTQKEILKVIKEKSTTSDGSGIGNAISSIGEFVEDLPGGGAPTTTGKPTKPGPGKKGGGKFKGVGKFIKGAGKTLLKGGAGIVGGLALEAGGDALKENGYQTAGDIVSTAGSATEGASTGAMIGSMAGPAGTVIGAAAGAVMGAAQGFSDSFGEGGLELINELRDKDAISYPVFGTTPTVEKWDVIEKLPKEQIQTLISTNEFEGKDLEHLQKLLEPPEAPKAEQVTPESQGYTPKAEDSISTPTRPIITGNETESELDAMNKSLGYSVVDLNPTKATPEVASPTQAESIYNQSGENAGISRSTSAGSNVINAPTVNNSNQTVTKNIIKVPVTNQDRTYTSYMKYVS
jgi:hypothetical protein